MTTNRHQNQELFWALRGGGGGTFAIVVQATVRVYPDDPTVVSAVSISAPRTDETFWKKGVVGLLATLSALNQDNIPGQFILSPSSATGMRAILTLYFMNTTVVSDAETHIVQQLTHLDGSGLRYNLSSVFRPRVSSELRMLPDVYPESYGILQGSVLVSNDLFNSLEGPSRLANTFAELPMHITDILFTSNLGGLVNQPATTDTAMHPAWRSSAQLINFVRGVEPSIEGKTNALNELTNIQMPILYSADRSLRVSYFNLGNPVEEDFQRLYWGGNYKRLYKIKQDMDKHGLFITRLGVGSEDWDADGMCRKTRSLLSRISTVLLSRIEQLSSSGHTYDMYE